MKEEEDSTAKLNVGPWGDNGSQMVQNHQKITPTHIKKERRRSKEEWFVVPTPPTTSEAKPPKPLPARVRELWCVAAATGSQSPPKTPPRSNFPSLPFHLPPPETYQPGPHSNLHQGVSDTESPIKQVPIRYQNWS